MQMAIKVLINTLGQHLMADVKQVSDTNTNLLIAYWVKDARLISYTQSEEVQDGVTINFVDPCPVASDNEYSIAESHIVSILEPKSEVLEAYLSRVLPEIPQDLDEVMKVEGDEPVVPVVDAETGLLPKPERPVTITREVV